MTLRAQNSIDEIPRKVEEVLKRIVVRYGSEVWRDSGRLQGLLHDHLGGGKYFREINVLLGAVSCSIPEELLQPHGHLPAELLEGQLAARLEENLSIKPEAARWAVGAWAVALSIPWKEDVPRHPVPGPTTAGSHETVTKITHADLTKFATDSGAKVVPASDATPQIPKAVQPRRTLAGRLSGVALVALVVLLLGGSTNWWYRSKLVTPDAGSSEPDLRTKPEAGLSAEKRQPEQPMLEARQSAEKQRRAWDVRSLLVEEAKRPPQAVEALQRFDSAAKAQEAGNYETARADFAEAERLWAQGLQQLSGQLQTTQADYIRRLGEVEVLLAQAEKLPTELRNNAESTRREVSADEARLARAVDDEKKQEIQQIKSELEQAKERRIRAEELLSLWQRHPQFGSSGPSWFAQASGYVRAAQQQAQAERYVEAAAELGRAHTLLSAPIAWHGNAEQHLRDAAPAYRQRGKECNLRKEYASAAREYERGIALDPTSSEAYWNRAFAYYWLGDRDTAIRDYSKAIELDPQYKLAYQNRAVAYANQQQYGTAIRDYSKAIELDSSYAAAYRGRGTAHANLGNNDAAIRDYDKAIEIDSNYASAYRGRGIVYANQGNNEAAIRDYDKTIELDPKDIVAFRNLGAAYYNMGRYDSSIVNYGKAIELDPTNPQPYRDRADGYEKLGDTANATRDRAKAKSLE